MIPPFRLRRSIIVGASERSSLLGSAVLRPRLEDLTERVIERRGGRKFRNAVRSEEHEIRCPARLLHTSAVPDG